MKKVQNIKEQPESQSFTLEERMIQQKAIAYDIMAQMEQLQLAMKQTNANIESIAQTIQKQNEEANLPTN